MRSATLDFIPELQFLRAVAVLSLLLYHIFPNCFPGGYVGFDIFFVLFGFLMTRSLLGEILTTGRIVLRRFYFRRLRRIIPAATLVLFAVICLIPVVLPSTMLQTAAAEVIYSSLWIENWRLAWRATDYLAHSGALSPVVHYWPVSIVEQFCVFYPLILLLCSKLCPKGKGHVGAVLAIICMTVASLAHSVLMTPVTSQAYLVTTTRVWELTAGGLLFFFKDKISLKPVVNSLLILVGFAGIAFSIFSFSETTLFPGWVALLPVGATCLLVITSFNSHQDISFLKKIMRVSPFQYLGGISYSVYLWHWPLCVFYTNTVSDQIGWGGGILIMVVTIVLSAIMKKYVEGRFRKVQYSSASLFRVCRQFVVSTALVILLAVGVIGSVEVAEGLLAAVPVDRSLFPGAVVTLKDGKAPGIQKGEYIPHPLVAKDTLPVCYDDGFHLGRDATVPKIGEYGDPSSRLSVFLVGDSQAAYWLPALQDIAIKFPFKIYHSTKGACLLSPSLTPYAKHKRPYSACSEWAQKVMLEIERLQPTVVVISNSSKYRSKRSGVQYAPHEFASQLKEVMNSIQSMGAKVLAIADTPAPGYDVADCMGRLCKDTNDCGFPYDAESVSHDIVSLAAAMSEGATLLNLNKNICPDNFCPAVVGNVLVYRDESHLTTEFAKTLVPFIEPILLRLLGANTVAGR